MPGGRLPPGRQRRPSGASRRASARETDAETDATCLGGRVTGHARRGRRRPRTRPSAAGKDLNAAVDLVRADWGRTRSPATGRRRHRGWTLGSARDAVDHYLVFEGGLPPDDDRDGEDPGLIPEISARPLVARVAWSDEPLDDD